jgi:diguanylate cyclase (GGDEF)-like protein
VDPKFDQTYARDAAQKVTLLREETDGLLTRLVQLRRQVTEIRRNFLKTPGSPPTRRVNEQLVLAALHAQIIAEAAVSRLDELARLSQRDPLTDLPNRMLMLDRLENAIAMAHRHRTRLAVLFVDLDGFKHINDKVGHSVGDQVLQLVARRLQSAIRASDTVSRHGGDEFLVLLPEVSQNADAALIAEKLLGAIAVPSRVGTHSMLSASIGIAIYPDHGADGPTLINNADAAMYRSKQRSPGHFEFYAAPAASDLPPDDAASTPGAGINSQP